MPDDGGGEEVEKEEEVEAQTEEESNEEEEEEEEIPTEKDEEDRNLIRLALHKSPFFTCLDDEQIEKFIEVAELKEYRTGQSIILEGCVDDAEPEPEKEHKRTKISPEGAAPLNKSEENILESSDEFSTTEEGFVLVEKTEAVINEGSTDGMTNLISDEAQPDSRVETLHTAQENNSKKDHRVEEKEDGDYSQIVERINDLIPKPSTTRPELSLRDDPTSERYLEPPPPKSGVPSYIYIIRSGQADVLYNSQTVSPASLGQGALFGEGGFLFGRQHSASVLTASEALECYVVDATTFRNYVLPSQNMAQLYQKHASGNDDNEEPYMTMQDFVNSCLDQDSPSPRKENSDNLQEEEEQKETIQDPLAGVRIANTFGILSNKQAKGQSLFSQRISLADFCLFHLLMARPDPEVDIIFLLMDERKRGVIYKEDVANFLKSSFDEFSFDMDSEFIHRHFGKGQRRSIRPHQFSQFLVDLRREIGQQVFLREVERNGTLEGYLSPSRFVQVLQKACGWRLPEGVAHRLERIYNSPQPLEAALNSKGRRTLPSVRKPTNPTPPLNVQATDSALRGRRPGAHYFSYCDFLAFQDVLGQLPGICSLIDRACEIKKGPISADDFKVANRVLGMGGRLSRRQVDIIFQLFDLDGDGYVSRADTVAVAGKEITQRIDAVAGRQGTLTFAPPPKFRPEKQQIAAEQPGNFRVLLQNFSLTSIAGAIGVFAMAPLDLVKTRLMNERFHPDFKRMYRNSADCLRIALVSEGYFGIYRGLLPQLIGIAPQNAIKLAVNDLLKQSFAPRDSGHGKYSLTYPQEMLAGGCAGACQLVVSNPIEIVKIRMQLQGETARLLKAKGFENPVPQSLRAVIRTLGYSGVFIGARACLLRDIPFGAIYFPTFSFLKEAIANGDEATSQSMSATNLLLAGSLAGVPASLLTTPADVIKTRLQVVPRPGDLRYGGIMDCYYKVYEREGPTAFFRGAAMRVTKISSLFGISLVAYEQLSQLLGVKGFLSPTSVPMDPKDYWEAFPARAIKTKANDTDSLLTNLGSNSLRPNSSSLQRR